MLTLKYPNYPFFIVEIFLDSTHYLKICYANIFSVQRIFSIEILLCGRSLMVVLLLIMATVYLTLTLVDSLEHFKAPQQPLPSYLCTHDSHTQS